MRNLVVLLLGALFFAGCSQKTPSKKDEISIMVSYFELNGKKQQLLIKSMPSLAEIFLIKIKLKVPTLS